MKMRRAISILVILVMALTFAAPMTGVYAAGSKTKKTKVKITKVKSPSAITAGKDFNVKGKIKSNKKIKRVEIGVTSKGGGKWTAQKYDNKKVNSKSFNVKKANKKLKFNKLKAGTYYYRIYVHTEDKKIKTVYNKKFTVKETKKKTVKVSAPNASKCKYPGNLTEGIAFFIRGTITAEQKMSQVTVGVVNRKTGNWTEQKYTETVNSKKFNTARADSSIKFGALTEGSYYYRIVVKIENKTFIVLNKPFNVEAATIEPLTIKTADSSNTGLTTYTNVAQSNSSKLTGATRPSKYKIGTPFTVRGIITSKEYIQRVEVGIIFDPTNKWTSHKYEKSLLLTKKFDLADAESVLSFDTLPAGKFRYRIYVHTDSGVQTLLDHPFEVTGSSKPMAAVKWAIKIANDDTFTYGAKPKANAIGCYFCGTNHGPVRYHKPKGYEKTYVCMTFIGAAYAHGAKDPEILDQCQKGRMTMYETDDNFKKFSCWMKLGSCRELKIEDLQPGDVLVYWSDHNDNNGHVCMYIGGDDLVESSGGGWGANSIAVKKGKATSRLKSMGYKKKNYVMRYTK